MVLILILPSISMVRARFYIFL